MIRAVIWRRDVRVKPAMPPVSMAWRGRRARSPHAKHLEELEACATPGEIRSPSTRAYEKVREDLGSLTRRAFGDRAGPDQRRRVLGVATISEAEVACLPEEPRCWHARRGLHRLRRSSRLGAARKAVLGGASWQRCQFHLAQNAIHHAPNLAIRKRIGKERLNSPDLLVKLRGRWRPGGKLRSATPSGSSASPRASSRSECHRKRMRTSTVERSPAGDQAPNRQGQGPTCRSSPPSSSRSTRNGHNRKPYISWNMMLIGTQPTQVAQILLDRNSVTQRPSVADADPRRAPANQSRRRICRCLRSST